MPYDEFLRFLKRYKPPTFKSKFGGKGGSVGGTLNKLTSAEAVASTPTATIREELSAAGVALPALEEMAALSVQFNEMLQESRARSQTMNYNKAQGPGSWHNLFKEMDEVRICRLHSPP